MGFHRYGGLNNISYREGNEQANTQRIKMLTNWQYFSVIIIEIYTDLLLDAM